MSNENNSLKKTPEMSEETYGEKILKNLSSFPHGHISQAPTVDLDSQYLAPGHHQSPRIMRNAGVMKEDTHGHTGSRGRIHKVRQDHEGGYSLPHRIMWKGNTVMR